MEQGQHSDRGDARGGDEVVELHERDARSAIQQRAGDRAHDDAGHLAAHDDDARQAGRMMGLQHEEHEQDGEHLGGDPGR